MKRLQNVVLCADAVLSYTRCGQALIEARTPGVLLFLLQVLTRSQEGVNGPAETAERTRLPGSGHS